LSTTRWQIRKLQNRKCGSRRNLGCTCLGEKLAEPLERRRQATLLTLSALFPSPHRLCSVACHPYFCTVLRRFGGAFGPRPCLKDACPPYDMVGWNPWNKPQNTWKALLKPTAATKGGSPTEYTINATCTGCAGGLWHVARAFASMSHRRKHSLFLIDSRTTLPHRLLVRRQPTSGRMWAYIWVCSFTARRVAALLCPILRLRHLSF
jgi:hypothetical protein